MTKPDSKPIKQQTNSSQHNPSIQVPQTSDTSISPKQNTKIIKNSKTQITRSMKKN